MALFSRRRALGALAVAGACFGAETENISFSGRDWRVKVTGGASPEGPGPCFFHRGNVWVDEMDYLHLRISQVAVRWTCAEVVGVESLGYGKYEFAVEDTSAIDDNAILGLFTWSDSAKFHHREVDIEISRWGQHAEPNAQFVVQPYTLPKNIVRFDLPAGDAVHSFSWSEERVVCATMRGGRVVREHTFTSGVPMAGGEHPRVNLWLFGGRGPASGHPVEVVVKWFRFEPLR